MGRGVRGAGIAPAPRSRAGATRRAARASGGAPAPRTLIFVDTNVLLDFYRTQGREVGTTVLTQLRRNAGRIITGPQVEMEFKANRQRVILDALRAVRTPDWSGLIAPAFLGVDRAARALKRHQDALNQESRRLRARIERLLTAPLRSDPVYQASEALFRAATPFNLGHHPDHEPDVHRLARDRFQRGAPPRKSRDTGMGDAINWEWLVHCAAAQGADVVVVTRDTDYGVTLGKEARPNDWLAQEFKARVGRRRTLRLTERLTEAFKTAGATVPRRAVDEERRQLDVLHPEGPAWERLAAGDGAAAAAGGAVTRRAALRTTLAHFPPKEAAVVGLAFGLDGPPRDLDKVAVTLGLSRRAVLAAYAAATRRLADAGWPVA